MVLSSIYEYLWGSVLRNLYFGGPALHGYGFWSNKSPVDMCSELTNVPADHWVKNEEECETLLQRNFRAFEIGVNTVIYITIGTFIVISSVCHCMLIRPFSNVIKKKD
jgi:hypothetical protein